MNSSRTHLPSLLSSLLFLLGALFFFSIGLIMGAAALGSVLAGKNVEASQTIFFLAFGFEGLILLIATFISIQKFLNKPSSEQHSILSLSGAQIAICIIAAGTVVLIGSQISGNQSVNWWLLPVLTIPAVALPLWLLLGLGIQKLPLGTRWQTWTVLGLGMTLGPLILITLEALVIIIGLIGAILYILSQPELSAEVQRLSQQMLLLDPNSEAALSLIAPYLTRPIVIVSALSYFALIIPAIEEIFKPIGVWIFAGKLESPAQGFALGALSGAGFALAETFGVSGQTSEWAGLLLSRIGTGLLHITTSALMGAAIVLAWRERRYFRLIGTYILAVALHGFWNALAITYTFSSLVDFLNQPGPLMTLQQPIGIGMGILAIVIFGILIISNHKMTVAASMLKPPSEATGTTPET
jgi:protease prsW family protein